jgi:hypothetical protein
VIGRILRAIAPPPPEPTAGGLPWSDVYPTRGGVGLRQRTYQPLRSIAASTSSVQLAAANAARRSLVIYNDSTADLYLAHGPAASTSGYTYKLAGGATYVLEEPGCYQGDVSGVWSAANGAARLTETM